MKRKPAYSWEDEMKSIYADLERRPVERACTRRQECCHFKLTGRVPYLTKGEALYAAKAFRATGRKSLVARQDGACAMLNAKGDCMIYSARPFGCRTHFCPAAGGPYSRRDVLDLIRRLEELDIQLKGDGSRPFQNAIEHALTEL